MTTNASRPELKFNRYDAVVAAIVALLAVAVALWFYLPKTQSGELTVVISTGGGQRLSHPGLRTHRNHHPRGAVHRLPARTGGRPSGGCGFRRHP